MKVLFALAAILIVPGVASSQERFKAVVGQSGNIELVPDPAASLLATPKGSTATSSDSTAIGSEKPTVGEALTWPTNQFDMVTADQFNKGIVVQKSPAGQIEALYPVGKVPEGLIDKVQPGTSFVKAGWFASEPVSADTMTQMEQTAAAASKRMFQAAMETACSFDPLPKTISPSVQVSFNLFAGAAFTAQAEWDVAEICKKKTPVAGSPG